MTHENQDVIRRWAGALNSGDLDAAITLLSPDYVGYFTSLVGGPVHGPEAFKQMFTYFVTPAFAEQSITIEHIVTSGDRTAIRMSWTAVHTGPFMNIPATGRQVVVTSTGIFRIENGLIAEEWMQEDYFGIYEQLS